MHIVVLSGGVGGSRFVRGVVGATTPSDTITVIANTADDMWLSGLRVCPDLDTLMYTLGDGIDPVRGWGRIDETWNARDELAAYGTEQAWFGLGDRDLATHLVRSQLLRGGLGLAAATARLCERWARGTDLGRITLLPMSEDDVETWVSTTVDGVDVDLHFQEFWVRHRATVPVRSLTHRGVDAASPAPGVLDAIEQADAILVAPSNPVVSIAPIVSVPAIRAALRTASAPVVGVSPLIGGSAVLGMADQLLAGLGIEATAAGVGLWHGARAGDGFLDGWLIDDVDAEQVSRLESNGIRTQAVPLWMRDQQTTHQLAADALRLATELDRG